MRVCDETARSRLTLLAWFSEPRFVRRRVSGATPTTKESLSNAVTVRQVPLTDMESPRWQSPRISDAEEMVREVPPVSSWGLSSETTSFGQYGARFWVYVDGSTSENFYYSCEHGVCGINNLRGYGVDRRSPDWSHRGHQPRRVEAGR